MQRNVILTNDGSHTIAIPEMNVTYHSIHGAIQESLHVFIEAGLKSASPLESARHILEVGFGTGLNALLTLMKTEKTTQIVHYTAIEPFPFEGKEISSLNYCEQLNRKDLHIIFEQLHNCRWEKEIKISETFYLKKTKQILQDYKPDKTYDLIYFDAFAPNAQPELWTKEIFAKIFSTLKPGGILVTYCSKGEVRRNMIAAGFNVEKIPGPPGKREMIRGKRDN